VWHHFEALATASACLASSQKARCIQWDVLRLAEVLARAVCTVKRPLGMSDVNLHSIGMMKGVHAVKLWQNETFIVAIT
jgi:hypothetical protein